MARDWCVAATILLRLHGEFVCGGVTALLFERKAGSFTKISRMTSSNSCGSWRGLNCLSKSTTAYQNPVVNFAIDRLLSIWNCSTGGTELNTWTNGLLLLTCKLRQLGIAVFLLGKGADYPSIASWLDTAERPATSQPYLPSSAAALHKSALHRQSANNYPGTHATKSGQHCPSL